MSNRLHRPFIFVGTGVAAAVLGLAAMSAGAQSSMSQETPSTSSSHDPSDAALAARVTQALKNDQALDSRHLKVSVRNGEVTLGGFGQDNRVVLTAQQVAAQAAPGHKIVNNIRVMQNNPNAP